MADVNVKHGHIRVFASERDPDIIRLNTQIQGEFEAQFTSASLTRDQAMDLIAAISAELIKTQWNKALDAFKIEREEGSNG